MKLFIAAALESAASLRAEREAIQELQLAPGLRRRLRLLATTRSARYDSKPGNALLARVAGRLGKIHRGIAGRRRFRPHESVHRKQFKENGSGSRSEFGCTYVPRAGLCAVVPSTNGVANCGCWLGRRSFTHCQSTVAVCDTNLFTSSWPLLLSLFAKSAL